MNGGRTDYARLLRLQRAIKAVQERELALAESRASAARAELTDLLNRLDGGNDVLDLFPDLVGRHIERILSEKTAAERAVSETGDRVVRENRKLETIETRYAEQRAADQRAGEEAAQSETLDQQIARALPASSKIGKLG